MKTFFANATAHGLDGCGAYSLKWKMLKVQYDGGKVVIIHYWNNKCMFSYKFWVFLPIWQAERYECKRAKKKPRKIEGAKEKRLGSTHTHTSQSKVVLCDELATIHKLLSPIRSLFHSLGSCFCCYYCWCFFTIENHWECKAKKPDQKVNKQHHTHKNHLHKPKLRSFPLFFRIIQTWHIFLPRTG